MTRINCVPPSELTNLHLLAEYRELPRVFTLVENRTGSGQLAAEVMRVVPETYRMGAGHVSFFYDKLQYLRVRHQALAEEMRSRGWNPLMDCTDRAGELHLDLQKDWVPTPEAQKANRQRIQERLR